MLPPLEKPLPALPEFLAAKGKRRARVALFTGCVGDVMFRQTNWATARVLQENGCDVRRAAEPGLLRGDPLSRRQQRAGPRNGRQERRRLRRRRRRCVIVNVAGCGSMLKDYGHHWHDEQQPAREQFAAKVRDCSEFLDQLGLIAPPGEIRLTATYHDACHLAHAQKVREQPRNLLKKIPGLKLIDLPESELCCGAAGTYNLTEPEMAERLGPPQARQHPLDRRRRRDHRQRRLPAANRPRSADARRDAEDHAPDGPARSFLPAPKRAVLGVKSLSGWDQRGRERAGPPVLDVALEPIADHLGEAADVHRGGKDHQRQQADHADDRQADLQLAHRPACRGRLRR